MRYVAFHGSPNGAFDRFDVTRSGQQSGYRHAEGIASLTSSVEVARRYAEGTGFIGAFRFELGNPLDIPDRARDRGLADMIAFAKSEGYDALILRDCQHDAISPGEPSDIFLVFDGTRPVRIETIQDPAPRPRRARSR